MEAQLRQLLRLDLSAIDVRKGVMGMASILGFIVFVAIFGTIGMTAALATLFVILADTPGPIRARGVGVAMMTIVGAVIAFIGVWAGPDRIVISSLLTFVVVALGTLAAGVSASAATRGVLLSVWAVLAISLAGDLETAVELAVAFVVGGLIAAAIIWVRTRALPEESMRTEAAEAGRALDQIVRSPLGWFAVIRGVAAGLGLWSGATLFPEHAIWASLTVILVMKPRAGEAIGVAVLRTLGTLLGVIAAELVILAGDGQDAVLALGFMLAAFGMGALQKVNYAVFVAFLTMVLVLTVEIIGGAGESAAVDRLLATALGAVIAAAAIGVGRLLMGRPLGTVSDPHDDDAEGVPG